MPKLTKEDFPLEDDPFWYKDAVIYETHVRAFFDSDGDGVGDFRGLRQKLEYLQDLGVTAIWLLPFYPSPLKDDGYDISNYRGIQPAYGTMRDFKAFLREAHTRGIRVITELVINHTSDQHPWFQRARRAKAGSKWRDFYVWSDTPERYKEARIIFKDFESSNWSWDSVAKAYYWHRFYSHQPDLNFENPLVRKAVHQALDFWLGLGVDGLRLDAVPYLYEREGTNCENLPETHAFLQELRHHVDQKFTNRMLLAEANQWPEDAVAYFGSGDECHMAFNFHIMPRLFMAIRMEDRFPIIDILEQTPTIPDICQWALFLRNHDELTLEMVTDEERDYMNRTYAHDPQMRINLGIRRRLAPLLGNDRRRIELMKGLLLSLPGTPVIYYGDEIGMGDNVFLGDRNGVRTPMQWSSDRNAGFSRANPQRLYLPVIIDPEYHFESLNVEAQQNNPHSLLWWNKRLIALRKGFKAFGRGTLEFLYPENRKVIVFTRQYEQECILVVANLSRFSQCVELDLSAYKEMVPIELFSRMDFPPIGDLPYFFTLGPHSFYMFSLERQRAPLEVAALPTTKEELPAMAVKEKWENIFSGRARAQLESALADYLPSRRWFGGKARRISSVKIKETIPVIHKGTKVMAAMAQVDYMDEEADTYSIPLAFAKDEKADQLYRDFPHAAVGWLELKDRAEKGLLYDALWDKDFCEEMLEAFARRRQFKGSTGELVAAPTRSFRRVRGGRDTELEASIMKAEQSNTSVVYGERLILKLFRRIDEGVNPDLEVGRFLTDRRFPHIPPVAGALEYRRRRSEPMTLGVLQGFVPNQGDAWEYTLDSLALYLERVLAIKAQLQEASLPDVTGISQIDQELPPLVVEMVGHYLESARLLGQRTAELHLALASAPDNPDFAPEPFSTLYQRSLYQSMRSLTGRTLPLLRRSLKSLNEPERAEAEEVLGLQDDIVDRFRLVLKRPISGMRIRCHGDYHLGQVLYTGKDFVIIDFEGEPALPLSERRIKRSPLRDVAGMLRSFHYAAYSALFRLEASGLALPEEDLSLLEKWAEFWNSWVGVKFLRGYLSAAGDSPILPQEEEELQVLLSVYLLEKAVYEMGYELNNRPSWVRIPLKGVKRQLQSHW